MKFETYRPSLLPAVVRFWNESFREKRNFWPVTPKVFRDRVVASRDFDPAGFIVALKGGRVVGLIHVAERRGESQNGRRATQGYVALFYVAPPERGKGVGNALWHRALDRLKGAHQVVLSFWSNPFYGAGRPFWGTPFGVGVEWRDGASQKFFARKGFAPRQKAVQLALDVGEAPWVDLEAVREDLARLGLKLGGRGGDRVTLLSEGRVAAGQSFTSMDDVRPGLYFLNPAEVSKGFERRPLGWPLLRAAIDRLRTRGARTCEALLLPETSEAAYRMYLDAGFVRAAEWAVYG